MPAGQSRLTLSVPSRSFLLTFSQGRNYCNGGPMMRHPQMLVISRSASAGAAGDDSANGWRPAPDTQHERLANPACRCVWLPVRQRHVGSLLGWELWAMRWVWARWDVAGGSAAGAAPGTVRAVSAAAALGHRALPGRAQATGPTAVT